jgi:hypothetical protein
MSGQGGLDAVIDALRARGLVPADHPPPPLEHAHRPWFVSLLSGAAGWLAGILLLIFAALIFKPDDDSTFVVLGVLLLGMAWGLYFVAEDRAFPAQLALALSIAGQVALAVGLLSDFKSTLPIAAGVLVLQLAVFVIMPDRTARTIAALFASMAWACVARAAMHPGFDWEDWFEPAYAEPYGVARIYLGWVAIWAPLVSLCAWLTLREPAWMSSPLRPYLRPALSGVLIVIALMGFASEPMAARELGPGGLGFDIGWWSPFSLLSIGLAVFAAWCAFRVRNLGLSGVAIVGALAHLGRFYYLSGTSLLWKSAIMLVVGMALVAGAVALRQREAAEGGS